MDDVRGKIAEANEPGEIGWAHLLPFGQCRKRHIAVDKCVIEPARSDQQLDQPRIGFRRGKRVGPIDQHRDLSSEAAQPHRDRKDRGFVVNHARQWRSCDIQGRTKPCRVETDVDLIGADVDAFD